MTKIYHPCMVCLTTISHEFPITADLWYHLCLATTFEHPLVKFTLRPVPELEVELQALEYLGYITTHEVEKDQLIVRVNGFVKESSFICIKREAHDVD